MGERENPTEQPFARQPENKEFFERMEFIIDSNTNLVDDEMKKINPFLEKIGIPEDQMFLHEIAVREAILNAIIHGNFGIEQNDYIVEGKESMENREAYERAISAANMDPTFAEK